MYSYEWSLLLVVVLLTPPPPPARPRSSSPDAAAGFFLSFDFVRHVRRTEKDFHSIFASCHVIRYIIGSYHIQLDHRVTGSLNLSLEQLLVWSRGTGSFRDAQLVGFPDAEACLRAVLDIGCSHLSRCLLGHYVLHDIRLCPVSSLWVRKLCWFFEFCGGLVEVLLPWKGHGGKFPHM